MQTEKWCHIYFVLFEQIILLFKIQFYDHKGHCVNHFKHIFVYKSSVAKNKDKMKRQRHWFNNIRTLYNHGKAVARKGQTFRKAKGFRHLPDLLEMRLHRHSTNAGPFSRSCGGLYKTSRYDRKAMKSKQRSYIRIKSDLKTATATFAVVVVILFRRFLIGPIQMHCVNAMRITHSQHACMRSVWCPWTLVDIVFEDSSTKEHTKHTKWNYSMYMSIHIRWFCVHNAGSLDWRMREIEWV